MSKLSVNQLYLNKQGFGVSDNCYRISMKTGVLAAGSVGANGILFQMIPLGQSIGAPTVAFIERIRLQYTCIAAFGTPITAGRSLAISGGGGLVATGGTLLTHPICKGSSFEFSLFDGRAMIANAGPLATATVKANAKLAELSLVGFGNAGATVDKTFDFTGDGTAPMALCLDTTLRADNTDLVIYSPQAMDATGTFELIVEVDTCELPR